MQEPNYLGIKTHHSHFRSIIGSPKILLSQNQGTIASFFEGTSGDLRAVLKAGFSRERCALGRACVELRVRLQAAHAFVWPRDWRFQMFLLWIFEYPLLFSAPHIRFSPFINLTWNTSLLSCNTHSLFSRRRWTWLYFGLNEHLELLFRCCGWSQTLNSFSWTLSPNFWACASIKGNTFHMALLLHSPNSPRDYFLRLGWGSRNLMNLFTLQQNTYFFSL